MASLAQGHFPQIRLRNQQKLLWDPIWKRTYITRPEECIRLQWVDLLMASGWSRNRISTELPVDSTTVDSKLFADLLCYDKQLNPYLLIECKAPKVVLKQLTAEQAGRYNQDIGAPFILLTNGHQDLWFKVDTQELEPTVQAIDYHSVLEPQSIDRDVTYWVDRGFISHSESENDLRAEFVRWLTVWHQSPSTTPTQWTYLNFDYLPQSVPSHHYYRLHATSDDSTWAITLVRGFNNSTHLVAALNQEGELRGTLLLSWDEGSFRNLQPSQSQLYLPDGPIGVKDSDHLHLISQWQEAETLSAFAESLNLLFQTYQSTG